MTAVEAFLALSLPIVLVLVGILVSFLFMFHNFSSRLSELSERMTDRLSELSDRMSDKFSELLRPLVKIEEYSSRLPDVEKGLNEILLSLPRGSQSVIVDLEKLGTTAIVSVGDRMANILKVEIRTGVSIMPMVAERVAQREEFSGVIRKIMAIPSLIELTIHEASAERAAEYVKRYLEILDSELLTQKSWEKDFEKNLSS